MHQTRRELLDDLLYFAGESNDADARRTAEGCLNRALTTLWLKLPWHVFRSPVPLQITLTANQSRYPLPDYVGRIGPGAVRNVSRQGSRIDRLQEGELERLFPGAGTTTEIPGAPTRFETAGTCGVHTQPAVAGEPLEAVSSDAADTDVVVAIDGDDADGRWTRAQVTLVGTIPVALGTWSFVDEFAKAYLATVAPGTTDTSSRGTITLRKVSDATELQQLFPQESAKAHEIFTIYPKPLSADVLAVPVIRKPKRLFRDADPIPDLWGPALFEEMLVEWQVNADDLTLAQAMQLPRPRFLDLAAFENQQRAPLRKTPFQR